MGFPLRICSEFIPIQPGRCCEVSERETRHEGRSFCTIFVAFDFEPRYLNGSRENTHKTRRFQTAYGPDGKTITGCVVVQSFYFPKTNQGIEKETGM